MAKCELCGTEGILFNTIVEGAKLNVCKKCASFGKVLAPAERPVVYTRPKEVKQTIEQTEMIIPGFSSIIRKKREQLGLSQKDFALKINEKESVVHKMETGELTPSIETAKKLEHILGIRLIEIYAEEKHLGKIKNSEALTIGDMIKIKERKS